MPQGSWKNDFEGSKWRGVSQVETVEDDGNQNRQLRLRLKDGQDMASNGGKAWDAGASKQAYSTRS